MRPSSTSRDGVRHSVRLDLGSCLPTSLTGRSYRSLWFFCLGCVWNLVCSHLRLAYGLPVPEAKLCELRSYTFPLTASPAEVGLRVPDRAHPFYLRSIRTARTLQLVLSFCDSQVSDVLRLRMLKVPETWLYFCDIGKGINQTCFPL